MCIWGWGGDCPLTPGESPFSSGDLKGGLAPKGIRSLLGMVTTGK